MTGVQRLLHRLDRFQQNHAVFGFPFGVVKKFGDDNGGHLAALMTYYGFVCLFPLLLVLLSVLGFVLHNDPDLQKRILDSVFAEMPVLGDQIRSNVTSLKGSGVAFVAGVLGTLYGGLGIAEVSQFAMNRLWGVPLRDRPGFIPRIARSLGLLATIGVGLIVSAVISGIAAAASFPALQRTVALALPLVFNVGLFLLAFQLLVGVYVRWLDLLPGAIVASVGWELLHLIGGLYITHFLEGASQVYGLFAFVLGLFAWISLLTRVVLYAAEVNVVRSEHLWPRSLAPPPYTRADDRALESYVGIQVRRPGDQARLASLKQDP
jgi:YihY family inner membrane protein